MIKYSIVIPVYNEVENLPVLIEEVNVTISHIPADCEIILVDDCSSDGGDKRMAQFAETQSNLTVIRFKENRGQSAALAAGFLSAKGEYVITMDSDLQNDASDLLKMIKFIPQYDMITGMRVNRNDSWIKKIDSKIANAVRNKLSRENIKDTGCSLKIMKTSYLRKIKMFRGMHRFLPTLLKMEGATSSGSASEPSPQNHGSIQIRDVGQGLKRTQGSAGSSLDAG